MSKSNQVVDPRGRKFTISRRGELFEARYHQQSAFGKTPQKAAKQLSRALRGFEFGVSHAAAA